MKAGCQTTLRERVPYGHRRSFGGSCTDHRFIPPMSTPALSSFAPDCQAGREAPVEAKRSNVTPDRSLHGARRASGAAVCDRRTSPGRRLWSPARQRADRDRRPEMPIMDGSSAALRRRRSTSRPRPSIASAPIFSRCSSPCAWSTGGCLGRTSARLRRGFRLDIEIDFELAGHRPAAPVVRSRSSDVPPGDFPRAHVRLRQRREEALADRLCPRVFAGELSRHRLRPDLESGGAALSGRVRASQGARRGGRSFSRWGADYGRLSRLSSRASVECDVP